MEFSLFLIDVHTEEVICIQYVCTYIKIQKLLIINAGTLKVSALLKTPL